jgi:hypothetical protein
MAVTIDGSASVTINSGAVLGITSGTAVASTSGTSINFTDIPSWVKRITVMLQGVSTNGSSLLRMQLGSGSVTTSGYLGASVSATAGQASGGSNISSGFDVTVFSPSASSLYVGSMVFTLTTGNNWTANGWIGLQASATVGTTAGNIALSGTLDRVRITTVNGTDTFDAGTINILYEG